MRAMIHSQFSPDLDDLEHSTPVESDCFGIAIIASIGSGDISGADQFTFVVCTPKWLAAQLEAQPYMLGRHYIIVPRYDWDTIKRALTDICAAAPGDDWESITAFLARYGHWEFEDYKGFEGQDG